VTAHLALRGAPSPDAPTDGVGARQLHLKARYGDEAAAVLAVARDRPSLLDPVVPGLPYLGVEVVYAAREEMARSLADVTARRTRALVQRAAETVAAAPSIAALLAPELGWTPAEEGAEIERFVATATSDLSSAGLVPAPAFGANLSPGSNPS
jgi:glycerol-3-phosphate dehydrogenase